MRQQLRLALAFTLSFLYVTKVCASPLIIATEGAYPPFSFFSEAQELTGFDVDIALALCEVLQRECQVIAVPWSELLDGLQKGHYHLVVASMAKTEERAQRALFTDYYYRSQTTFIGDPRRILSLVPQSLIGKRLSAGRDSIQAEFLLNTYTESEIVLTDNLDEAFRLLSQGEVDLVLTDSINSLGFLTSPEGASFDFIGEPIIDPLLVAEARIAVSSDHPSLVEALN